MNAPGEPLVSNPLLDFSGLPRFGEITPEHVAPAVDTLIADARATVERVAGGETPSWEGFVLPLAAAQDRLDRAWGQVAHLNAVVNTPALREAYNASLPKVTSFHTDLGQDERLFSGYRALADAPGFASLDAARRKLIENTLRDFRLSGAELSADRKARFKAIEEELSQLSSRFEDNVLDATNDYGLFIDDAAKLSGIPADVQETAKKAGEEEKKPGWKLTLRAPCYQPVMQYADDRSLRETLYRAYATRASEFGKADWDNSALIDRIVALRRDSA